MQTNTQPDFKSIDISEKGYHILQDRLPDYKFELFLDRFSKTFNNQEYDILMHKSKKSKKRLEAVIKYDKNNVRHIKEGFFSYLFNKPFNFIDKLEKQVKKDLTDISQNKQISIV